MVRGARSGGDLPEVSAPQVPEVSAPRPVGEAETTGRPHHESHGPDAESAENADTAETPEENRSSIENWMAELRSSRRRVASNADEGRHHGSDGRTVSVNELLRRRDPE